MTHRTETFTPATAATRRHLIEHRDELREHAKLLDVDAADLRTDAQRGAPIPADAVRVVAEARDLLVLAAHMVDPDREEAPRGR